MQMNADLCGYISIFNVGFEIQSGYGVYNTLKTHFIGQFSQFHGPVIFPPLCAILNYNILL